MEAGTAPRAAPAGVSGIASSRLLRVAPDERLVALVREGKGAAFEAAYDRHHRAILSFCRHMLGSLEEAEDAVQHTFLAAYNDLVSSQKPIHLRAWLFTIARNRCYSILRARREQPLSELDEPATEGLATQVQRRQDLRDLVGDLRRLPDEQRAALVLSEMDSLTHEQIADVLGVPKDKVKALVFQARESLVASRAARETDCAEIREQLANLHGGALRRANLRRHLHECAGCREFRQEVDRQRRQLRVLLPVAPTLALKETVLAATVGGGVTVSAATGGGGVFAGSLLKGGVVKGLLGAALAGVGTAGTIVAVHDFQVGVGSGFRFGGSHQLTSHAPFTPAPAVRTEARRSVSSTSSYRSTPAPHYAGAVGSYAARIGGASPRSATSTATATMIAVLHPLSPKGLTSTLIPSPLLPPVAPGTGSTVAGHAVHSPQTSSVAPIPPYLAPSAFGAGDQSSTGGARSTSSTRSVAPSTPSTPGSNPNTGQSLPLSSNSYGQSQSGAGSYSAPHLSGGGTSGVSSHATAPSSSGSSSTGWSPASQGSSLGGGSRSTASSGSSGSSSTGGSSSGSGGWDSSAAGSGSSGAGSSGSGSSGSGSSGSGSSGTGSSGSGASGAGSSSGSSGTGDGSGYGGGSNTGPHGR